MDRRPPRSFFCGEEGHFVSNCPAHPVLQRLLRQQASASARGLPRGQILELPQPEDDSQGHCNVQLKLLDGSPEAKVTPVGCTVGPPITGQLNLEGIPVLGLVETGASVICMRFSVWCQYRAQWGPLKSFEGSSTVPTANHSRLQGRPNTLTSNGAKLEDGPASS